MRRSHLVVSGLILPIGAAAVIQCMPHRTPSADRPAAAPITRRANSLVIPGPVKQSPATAREQEREGDERAHERARAAAAAAGGAAGAVTAAREHEDERFDSPREAWDFYARKRAPI